MTACHQIRAVVRRKQASQGDQILSFPAYRRGLRFRDMMRPRTLSGGNGRRLLTRPPLDRMNRIFCAIKAGDWPNTLSSLNEIERWVLSWAEHALALAPAELTKRLSAIYVACARKLAK